MPDQHLPLNRERVLRAAVALADEQGLNALTMRRLGERLGVEAMSLYNHVANKDDILGGMVELVYGEIELPDDAPDWKTAMRRRAISAREVLGQHPWALMLMDSRISPGPATLRHHNWVIGRLRAGGFPIDLAAHAFSILDSFIFGFVIQDTSLPFDTAGDASETAAAMTEEFPVEQYPHLAELIAEHVMRPGYRYTDEFPFGLEMILDGLERLKDSAGQGA
jgi:AcrR family transcriptional regulator